MTRRTNVTVINVSKCREDIAATVSCTVFMARWKMLFLSSYELENSEQTIKYIRLKLPGRALNISSQ
jgi:hypothetical protein